MTELNVFKKQMRSYFNTVVDKEDGETFTSWFNALMSALKEEGKVKIVDGKTYIEE